jgi:hypothetical protein
LGPEVPVAECRVEGVAWLWAAALEVAVPPSVPALAAASGVRRDVARRAEARPMAAAHVGQPAVPGAAAPLDEVVEAVPGAAAAEGVAPGVAVAEAVEAPDAGVEEVVAPDVEAAPAVPAGRVAAEPWAAAWISLLPWPARRRSAPIAPVIALSPTAWP